MSVTPPEKLAAGTQKLVVWVGCIFRFYFSVELLVACNLPQSNLWVEAPDSLKFSIEFMIRVDIS